MTFKKNNKMKLNTFRVLTSVFLSLALQPSAFSMKKKLGLSGQFFLYQQSDQKQKKQKSFKKCAPLQQDTKEPVEQQEPLKKINPLVQSIKEPVVAKENSKFGTVRPLRHFPKKGTDRKNEEVYLETQGLKAFKEYLGNEAGQNVIFSDVAPLYQQVKLCDNLMEGTELSNEDKAALIVGGDNYLQSCTQIPSIFSKSIGRG
jgi:hypothetical protein